MIASGAIGTLDEDLARIDRKRAKKGSNDEWKNPHDPDAQVTEMKDGRTHLAHKAEHAVDLTVGFRPREVQFDAAGGRGLLHLGVARECDRFHIEPALLEKALLHADVERHERKRLRNRLADANLLGLCRSF